jgi:crotonobetainyl-CoA:carnitine CoA-transferase CaiB-like acyl-CoA transferase
MSYVDDRQDSPTPPPLAGIRILDVTRFLAGPYAGLILAEMGASVIKLEDPDRPDEGRSVGPYFQAGQSLYFAALNSGKRSVAIRMSDPAGQEAARRIALSCDVVLDNHKTNGMSRLGLSSDRLRAANPGLVTCSLSGFGATGPARARAGYDYTIQALGGVMSLTGEPSGPPGKAGISYVDHSGGIAAALAVCGALVARVRTGLGRHIDLALLDVQISMLSYLASWHLNAGYAGERHADAAHPSLVPAQNFATRDGYISVFVGNDAMWERLVACLDDPALLAGEYATSRGRQVHRVELVAHLSAVFACADTEHWTTLLDAHSVPCARVNSLEQALAEPQVEARRLVTSAVHPSYGAYRHVGGPLVDMRTRPLRAAPGLGEHTVEVLREAGCRLDEVDRWRDLGIVEESHPGDAP